MEMGVIWWQFFRRIGTVSPPPPSQLSYIEKHQKNANYIFKELSFYI